MSLEAVPDLFPVGSVVRMFPAVEGRVVAIEGERRVVETSSGVRHTVDLGALQAANGDAVGTGL